jgi:hypothetical protein
MQDIKVKVKLGYFIFFDQDIVECMIEFRIDGLLSHLDA